MEEGKERQGASQARKKYGKHSRKGGGWVSRILVILQTLLTVLLVWQVYTLNMLPIKYFAAAVGILAVLLLIPWILTFRRSRAARNVGSVISLLMIIVLALGNYYLWNTNSTLEDITGATTIIQTDEVSVIVLKDSTMEVMNDLAGSKLGIQAAMDRENTDKTLAELDKNLEQPTDNVEYEGMADMVQALYDAQVDAIVLNESYRDLVKDEFEKFDSETRVLGSFTFETEIEVAEDKVDKDLSKEPFIVYMSGIDTYGSVTARSRSDVNIMAVVNPVTKQVLLVTTPRDYYVPLPVAGNSMDKLTHAGIYGIDASIETLENLYGLDIDFYVRMNFTGFMDIVDALGGVDVYSSRNFVSEVGGFTFTKGYNTVNGEMALGFVRERHSFGDGDFQRQRNQMEMVKAILKKAASPAILTSYTSLLKTLENSFTTDMSSDDLSELVKMQLNDGGEWSFDTYGVTGEGARRTTYSMGSRSLYVCLQDENSINQAKELIQAVMDGKLLSEIMEESSEESTEAK